MKRVILLFTALVLCIGVAFGQETTINGTVVDETGETVIGAAVQVEGTQVGTITDIDGNFTIKVPAGKKILVFSYVGMATIKQEAKNGMKVVMTAEATQIDEVMVVAYGTSTKKSFAGSATVVKGETLEKKNPSDVTKALAGEIAGVQVVSSTGQPGTTASVRIRGIGSVNSSTSPLYVVDGIPFDGDISGIDPSDIASTTVLKDATATSLYGSRGANGVILITTKKGTSGESGKIDIDVKYGANMRLIPMYETIGDAQRYVELCWEGIANGYGDDVDLRKTANRQIFDVSAGGLPAAYNRWTTPGDQLIDPYTGKFVEGVTLKQGYIDDPEKGWDKAMFNNGQKIEANLKIHGGSDKTTYYTSFGYLKDEGYYIGSDYDRLTARVNVDHQAKKWLKGNMNIAYTYSHQNAPGQSSNMNNGFAYVNECPAIYPVFQRDANGYRVYDSKITNSDGSHPYAYDYGDVDHNGNVIGRTYGNGINPAGALKYDKDRTERHQLAANAMLEVTFYKGLKLQSNIGLQFVGSNNSDLTNVYYGDAAGVGRINKTQQNYLSFTWNQILSYTTDFGGRDHNLDAFVAHETGYLSNSQMYASQNYTARPEGLELSNAIEMSGIASETVKASIESYFAQVRYNYKERYFFHGTIRGDGSSRFAKGNRWGCFGAVGVAWLMTNEDFMQDQSVTDVIKNLKIKASWGRLGNQDIGLFLYTNQYGISNVDGEVGYSLSYIGNKDLTWEKSSIWNVGFEMGLTKYLDLEFEYFYKTTTDMLFPRSVAPSLGYSYYYVNDGALMNQGVEFSANVHAVDMKNVRLDIRLNGAWYENKVTQMPLDNNGKRMNMNGAMSVGHSLYDYYTVEYAGVNGATGKALYVSYYNPADLVTPGVYDERYDYISSVHSYILEHYVTDEDVYNENIAKGQYCVLVSKKTQQKYLDNPDLILEKTVTENYNYASSKYVGKCASPKLQGGFGFDLSVYGVELSAAFTYSLGGWGSDGAYELLMHSDRAGERNWHKDIENRWTYEIGAKWDQMSASERAKVVPRLSNGKDNYANSGSTRFINSSDYLALSNIRIGYSFPKKWMEKIHLNNLSVFVSGDNLFCLSIRKGYIPMMSFSGGSSTYSYSPLSTIMGGIKISF